ncbi:TraR/DksA C4-type zinc finger protein [Kribbella sp. NPDC003557]|uniref:TraR/DksA family transcriptional regulator n=1 Tax=Kribbella sp. NPDC003557 TaxID=3154449 RepID=UPI0033ADD585
MNQERPADVRPNQQALDVGWFRQQLCHERQFRLDQLVGLTTEQTTTPCSAAVAEVRAVLEAGARRALAEIDAALLRLAGGVFGACEMCGEMISPHRLQALPTIRLCLRCEHRSTAESEDIYLSPS